MMLEEFSRIGGGQQLFTHVHNAIREGNVLSLITDRYSAQNLQFKEVFRTSFSYSEGINLFTLILRVKRLRRQISAIMSKSHYDLVFNNHPNLFLFKGDINYLHSFSFLDPIIDEQGIIRNRFIFQAIKKSDIYGIYNEANFLTHGIFTMELSKKMFPSLNLNPRSIKYIFTPVSKFYDIDFSEKEGVVLTFGRINAEKGLDLLLNVANNMKDVKFVMAGAVNKGDESYATYLEERAPPNLKVLRNPSEEEKRKLYKKAKIYLHTRKNEPYGVTVAEAVSNGCIPVVPESGGPWIDIIEMGKYGLGFKNFPEDTIRSALGTGNEFAKTILQSRDRFSIQTFNRKLSDYIQTIEVSKDI